MLRLNRYSIQNYGFVYFSRRKMTQYRFKSSQKVFFSHKSQVALQKDTTKKLTTSKSIDEVVDLYEQNKDMYDSINLITSIHRLGVHCNNGQQEAFKAHKEVIGSMFAKVIWCVEMLFDHMYLVFHLHAHGIRVMYC